MPEENATFSAALTPCRAASAVRTFARTATFIPMKPAAAERTAPIRKPNAVPQPRSFQSPMPRNSTAATTEIVMYCRRRYADAPSCTARAISCMRSLPAGRASRRTVRTTAHTIPTTAQISANSTL